MFCLSSSSRNIFCQFIGFFLFSIILFSYPFFSDEDETIVTDNFDYPTVGGKLSRLEPLGNDLMGDMIDKKTGGIMFRHTDVSIPGNSSLEVALHRKKVRAKLIELLFNKVSTTGK